MPRNKEEKIYRSLFAILVENEVGVLARVIGLFSARGYNIESLNVACVDKKRNLSRITIITKGTTKVIERIQKQLSCLVPVHHVQELTSLSIEVIEREMALVKLSVDNEQKVEALRIVNIFKGKVVDISFSSCTFEITGTPSKIDAFLLLLSHMNIVDLARSGVAAINRGDVLLHENMLK